MTNLVAKPWLDDTLRLKPFLERDDALLKWWDRLALKCLRALRPATTSPLLIGASRLVWLTRHAALALAEIDDAALMARAEQARDTLRRSGLTTRALAGAFAVVIEATARERGMRHFPVQIMAARHMLAGRVVEMATGEGKSLTAVLAAATAALAGLKTHIVTVNDYLAQRDAEELGPIYRRLGISVGLVIHGQEEAERKAAYDRDVVYCTNKELAFDYLRDRMALGQRRGRARLILLKRAERSGVVPRIVQRGLVLAIVDEIDSILIDEARTPLLISLPEKLLLTRADCEQALSVAGSLTPGDDYALDMRRRVVSLTGAGERKALMQGGEFSGPWRLARARRSLIEQALSALHLFDPDQHYIIVDGKVQIVDEFTGRTMADRQWSVGLHQLIEVKHGLDPSGVRTTAAQITYQRFFRRYVRLTGMTGTAREVARELTEVYDLDVVGMPTHRKPKRYRFGVRVYCNADSKWCAVVANARRMVLRGRSVLIGTRSVAASEQISHRLTQAGLAHAMLSARHNADEAAIVARAGEPGTITVATNMAGRGTDIKLHDSVRAAGGLHVILTEYHESARIDRQLYGRAARQGDPGSCIAIVSLDDDLFERYAPRRARLASILPIGLSGRRPAWIGRWLAAAAQRKAERRGRAARAEALKRSDDLDRQLSFGVLPE